MANEFRKKLIDALSNVKSLTTREIYDLFSDMNQSTVSWHLHEEFGKGFVEKCGHGSYRLSSTTPDDRERLSKIPNLSTAAFACLKDSGYDFYLSGLDCMNGIGFKVDGSYPVILCTRKQSIKDVQLLLMREFDLAITEEESNLLGMGRLKSRIQFVILSSSNFVLQSDGFAFPEKAFVDLYFAVTRMEYPLPVRELPHVLSLINPNLYRFRNATKDRGLSSELNFLISYNRDFVKAFAEFI
ncbi:MAG: helix-turn-helix transcriptional regulator [Spirochaetales bacterium]|nr:helix-turn-helix transcriptional regulator [Spirochaetales bacterium]